MKQVKRSLSTLGTLSTALFACALMLPSIPVARAQYLILPNPLHVAAAIGQAVPYSILVTNIGTDTTTPVTAIASILNTDEWTITGSTMKTITTNATFDLQFLPETTSAQDTGSLQIFIAGTTYLVPLVGYVLPLPHYTWKPTGFAAGPIVRAIFIQPSSGYIFAGTQDSGIYRSTDGGCGWSGVDSGLASRKVRAIVQAANGAIYAGTDSGIYRSFNNGTSWSTADSGLTNLHVRSLAVITRSVLMAGTNTSGIYASTDTGTSWKKIMPKPNPDSTPVPLLQTMDVEAIAIDGRGIIYAGTAGRGILRSMDTGARWRLADSLGVTTNVKSFTTTTMAGAAMLVLAGTSAGMRRTGDSGKTWASENSGLGTHTNVNALATDAIGMMLAATDAGTDTTGLVFESYDGGVNWIQRDSGLPAIHSLAISGGTKFNSGGAALAANGGGSTGEIRTAEYYTNAFVGTSGGGLYSATSLDCGPHSTALNTILIKFKQGHLNCTPLCYNCGYIPPETRADTVEAASSACWSMLRAQTFSTSSLLSSRMDSEVKAYGGLYLMRNSVDNPCSDTLSRTRDSGTIRSDNYNILRLVLNNDTNAAALVGDLRSNFRDEVQLVSVIHPIQFTSLADPLFDEQWSLQNTGGIGMPDAWTIEVGDPSVTVAVVDNGLDYRRLEFGGNTFTAQNIGPGFKVRGGWDYTKYNQGTVLGTEFTIDGSQSTPTLVIADHGTPVASIIAARRNNTDLPGIAGIAGGDDTKGNAGATLVGYCASDNGNGLDAINNASILSTNDGEGWAPGKHVDVINNSWIAGISPGSLSYDPLLQDAVINAYANGVVVVCGKSDNGEDGTDPTQRWFPADLDPSFLVIDVGAADKSMNTESYSAIGPNVDLIAPGGDVVSSGDNVLSVDQGRDDIPNPSFFGTSAATPHVTGVVANLLHFQSLHQGDQFDMRPLPEDIAGMIESATMPPPEESSWGYHLKSGWGYLHAGKLFATMLNPNGLRYSLRHFAIPNASLDKTQTFSDPANVHMMPTTNFGSELSFFDQIAKESHRDVAGSLALATDVPTGFQWDTQHDLYVWGSPSLTKDATTGKITSLNGYALSAIDPEGGDALNFALPYCEVTDGTAGNTLVPGILHDQSLTIQAKTIQYEFFDASGAQLGITGTNTNGHYPQDGQIDVSFSVFGALHGPLSVKQGASTDGGLSVFPSIASSRLTLGFSGAVLPNGVVFYNVLGEVCKRTALRTRTADMDISEFAEGSYFVVCSSALGTSSARFIVRR